MQSPKSPLRAALLNLSPSATPAGLPWRGLCLVANFFPSVVHSVHVGACFPHAGQIALFGENLMEGYSGDPTVMED